jgi:hypothetical protein
LMEVFLNGLVQIIKATHFVMIVIMVIYVILLSLALVLLVLVHSLVFVVLVFLIGNVAVLGGALRVEVRFSKRRKVWLHYRVLQALLSMLLFQLLLLLELLGNTFNGLCLVDLEGVCTLFLNLHIEVAGFIAKKQLLGQEFSSAIQVTIMNLVEMSAEVLETHTEQTVGTVVYIC